MSSAMPTSALCYCQQNEKVKNEDAKCMYKIFVQNASISLVVVILRFSAAELMTGVSIIFDVSYNFEKDKNAPGIRASAHGTDRGNMLSPRSLLVYTHEWKSE